MTSLNELLAIHIADHEYIGSSNESNSLGIQATPDGYALMINPDRTYFYWLRFDGSQGAENWNKWAVYRSAKRDSQK